MNIVLYNYKKKAEDKLNEEENRAKLRLYPSIHPMMISLYMKLY